MLKVTRVKPFKKGVPDPTYQYLVTKLYDYYLYNLKSEPSNSSTDKGYDRLELAIKKDATIDLINLILQEGGYTVNDLHRLDFSKKIKK